MEKLHHGQYSELGGTGQVQRRNLCLYSLRVAMIVSLMKPPSANRDAAAF